MSIVFDAYALYPSLLGRSAPADADSTANPQEPAGDPVPTGKVDVKGKSKAVPAQFVDDVDAQMDDAGEMLSDLVYVHLRPSDHRVGAARNMAVGDTAMEDIMPSVIDRARSLSLGAAGNSGYVDTETAKVCLLRVVLNG